ncbi:MAG: hypothetical protein ACRDHE_09490, partial [Ktedonobacterales bacterium]
MWSDRRLQDALLIVMVVLLETLPIEAWQLILAGYSHTIARPPLPWWLLLAIPLVSYLTMPAGARGRRHFASGAFVAFIVLAALLLRFSPATYADSAHGLLDLGWLATLGNDAAAGDARFGAVVALLAVAVYLRWRGARLKSVRLDTQDTLQRFKYGMVIVTVAAVVALTLDTSQKSIALGVLA